MIELQTASAAGSAGYNRAGGIYVKAGDKTAGIVHAYTFFDTKGAINEALSAAGFSEKGGDELVDFLKNKSDTEVNAYFKMQQTALSLAFEKVAGKGSGAERETSRDERIIGKFGKWAGKQQDSSTANQLVTHGGPNADPAKAQQAGDFLSFIALSGFGELGETGLRPSSVGPGFYVELELSNRFFGQEMARQQMKGMGTLDPASTFINQYNPVAMLAQATQNVRLATISGKNEGYMWEAQALNMAKAPIVATGSALVIMGAPILAGGGPMAPVGGAIVAAGTAVMMAGNSINVNPTTGERIMKATDQSAVATAMGAITAFFGGAQIVSGYGGILMSGASALGQSSVRYDADGRSQGVSLTSWKGDHHGERAVLNASVAVMASAGGMYAGEVKAPGTDSALGNAILGDISSTAFGVISEYGAQQTWGREHSNYESLTKPDAGRLGALAGEIAVATEKDATAREIDEQTRAASENERKQRVIDVLRSRGIRRPEDLDREFAANVFWKQTRQETDDFIRELKALGIDTSNMEALAGNYRQYDAALRQEMDFVREKLVYDVRGAMREWEFRETRERDPLGALRRLQQNSEPAAPVISEAEKAAKFKEYADLYLRPEVIELMARAHLAARAGETYRSEDLQVKSQVQWRGETFVVTARAGNEITLTKAGGGSYRVLFENGTLGGYNAGGIATHMNDPVTRSGKSEYVYQRTGDASLAGMAGYGNELNWFDRGIAPVLKAVGGIDFGITSNLYHAARFMMLSGDKGYWRGMAYGGAVEQARDHGWDGGFSSFAEGVAAVATAIPTGGAGLLAKAGTKAALLAAKLAAKGGALAKIGSGAASVMSLTLITVSRALGFENTVAQMHAELGLAVNTMVRAGQNPQVLLDHINAIAHVDAAGLVNINAVREKIGIAYTVRRMTENGWELMGDSLHYGANHGLDLAFKQGTDETLKYAIAEAKYSKGLGSLAHDVNGLRQGSWQYIEDRLRQLALRDQDGTEVANKLLGAHAKGQLQSYGGFYRADRLYRLDFNQTQIFLPNGQAAYQRYRFLSGKGARVVP